MNGKNEIAHRTRQRRLKIEAVGDFARGQIKPRIRLSGHWLEHAGFKPGHHVEIHLRQPGEMSLQFKESPDPKRELQSASAP